MINKYLDWLTDNLIDPEDKEQLKDKKGLNNDETILANSTNK